MIYKSSITISVDAMGGDHGPKVTIPAVIEILKHHPNLHIILVGDQAVLTPLLAHHLPSDHLAIHHASQTVEMHELPSLALRNKKDSSMRVAINLVKEGKAGACVSAGNTGALMATARFVLKMLPGIDRPAIISAFPTIHANKVVRILDLGANVDCTAEHLFQFAIMASAFASAILNIEKPKIFLLNIGEEEIKGNEQVKLAAQRLANAKQINYAGYIEGDALFSGLADVIVCDGFVGNVTLKTTEGVARMITTLMKESFMQNAWTTFVGLLVKPILKLFAKRINPSEYNGASFLGLNGIVIKSHGGASVHGFARAIEEAIDSVEKDVPSRIKSQLEHLLSQSSHNKESD